MTRKRELKRQLFHIVTGIIIVLLFHLNIITLKLFGIIIIAGSIISLAWKKDANPIIGFFLKNFERNGRKAGHGAMWFFIGAFIVLYIFPQNIALASIMILALGDSVSHYVGRFHGRRKHPLNKKRNVEGTIAGVLIGSMGAMFFVAAHYAFFAAFVAMNVEVIEWEILGYKVNDNVVVPVVASIVLQVLI
jgi:dolichol kinase